MADTIDSLLIDIQAQSKDVDQRLGNISIALGQMADAVSSIDTTKLVSLANGLSQITQSVRGLGSLNSRTFTSFADKINQISNINASGLSVVSESFTRLSNSLSGMNAMGETVASIRDLATAIGRLGGVSVQKAVANLPSLTSAMMDMMRTLSNAPQVSQKVIDMTNALAYLSSQGQKVGSASASLQRTIKTTTDVVTKSNSIWNSFIFTLAKLRFVINMLKRAFSNLWETVESAMNYTETYNYWNVVLDKISKETISSAESTGTESAESYVDAYSDRMKTLIQRMTGFEIGDNGELLETNALNLGMDANQLMQYQAKILGITNAVGLMGDVSSDTSTALSMLAGDLSSLTNQDLETVMGNLTSGLIGQSRALYKYGIDITNNTLQQYAFANGINQSVSSMTQAEKMQLRLLAILDQSKVAWGDQINTLGSVANQYRILKQQIANLGRVIGNLFLPIIQKVLPYINGLIIAIRRLLTLLGFKLYGDSWLTNLQDGISGGASATDDLVDGLEDSTDAMDDASASAKKLKSNLLGIDELNVLNQDDNSGGSTSKNNNLGGGFDLSGAIDDALAEYESIWDKAFKDLENKAQAIADKIMAFFEKIGQSKFWSKVKELAHWLGVIAGYVFDSVIDLWNNFMKPVASWLGNTVFAKLVDIFVDFVKKVDWSKLTIALKKVYQVLSKFVIGIGQGLLNFFSVLAEFGLTVLATAINIMATALDGLATVLLKIPDEVLIGIGGAIGGLLATIWAYKNIPKIIDGIVTAFTTLYVAISDFFIFLSANPVVAVIGGVAIALGSIIAVIKDARDLGKETAFESMISSITESGTTIDQLADKFRSASDEIVGSFGQIVESFDSLESTRNSTDATFESVKTLVDGIQLGAYSIDGSIEEIIASFNKLYEDSQSIFDQEYDIIIQGIAGAVGDAYAQMGGDVQGIISNLFLIKNQGDVALAGIKESIASLETQYEDGSIGADEYATKVYDLYKQLAEFNGQDVVGQAKEQWQGLAESLDLSDFVDESGAFDTSKFETYFADLTETYNTGLADIQASSDDYIATIQGFQEQLDALGVEYDASQFQALYDANKVATEQAKADYELAWQEFTDQIQIGVAEELPNIIKNATADYDQFKEEHPFKALFTPKDTFVQESVDEWRDTVVDPIFDQLGDTITTKSEDGELWGETLIDSMVTGMYTGIGDMDFDGMTSNIQSALDTAFYLLDTDKYGEQTIQGYNDYIANNTTMSDGVMQDWADAIWKAFHDSRLQFGSPSKAMNDFALDVIAGFNEGMGDQTAWISTKETINAYAKYIKDTFDAKMPEFKAIGQNIGQGIADGLVSKQQAILDSVRVIANAIQSTFQVTLDIHSPSRKMFALGEYTIEGLKLGMESLYESTTKSLGRFANSLVAQPVQATYDMTSAINSSGRISAQQSEQTESVLANVLIPYLSQIVNNTRESANKDFSVNIGDREIARANARGQMLMGASLIS